MVDIDKLEALEKTWEMVKDLKPLRPHEVEHFTRCCFRDSPGQPNGWVREYMPRIVHTLLSEVRELRGIAEAARVQHLENDCLTCSWMRDTEIIGMCVMAHELAEYDAGGAK